MIYEGSYSLVRWNISWDTVVMSRKSENWLLVEWLDGSTGVVYVNSVLSPVNKELKPGDTLTVNWRGEPKSAKLLARAKERDQVESKNNEETAPSPKADDEELDFSASGSSWAPSEGAMSVDSDKETFKKIKLEHSRQYINRRTSKKVLTPSHRANAVIPTQMLQETNLKVNRDNRNGRKRTYNKISQNGSTNKPLVPDSTKINKTMNTLNRKNTILHKIEEIKKTFKQLFGQLEDYKRKKVAQLNMAGVTVAPKNVEDTTLNANGNDTVINGHYESEDNEEYDNVDEFNRSDDNVLITNKYSNQYTDASSVSPNERVKTNTNFEIDQKEWVPIGSGKTMIHVDQFRKVKWKSYTIATRTLLLAIFPRRILATHSLTGKRSPAFQNKPAKMCLDPKIISDVLMEITDRFNVKENLVRSIITTKCADECKMWKQRKAKKSVSNHNEDDKNESEFDV